jgi:Tol biopolymer transport system component
MKNSSHRIRYWFVVSMALLLGMSRIEGLRGGQSGPAAARTLYQQALHEEDATGNLKAAIALYQRVLAAKPDRTLAAQALIHMAECYRKLGDPQSRTIYRQVLRDYADQKDAAAVAQSRLEAVEHARQTTTMVWAPGNPNSPNFATTEGLVSPDGRYLSFTNWETGDLELHDFATETNRNITHPGGGKPVYCGNCYEDFAQGSAISKDGKQVAYNWWNNDRQRPELRIASLQGDAHAQTLYDNPEVSWFSAFDWSPDGKLIAVQVDRLDHTKQIGLVSASDHSLRILKSVDWRGTRRIFFSPDGQYLAYDLPQNESSPQRDVFVLSRDGAHETRAVASPGNDIMMGWSPDGRWLLFGSDRAGSNSLWGVAFAGGKVEGVPRSLRAGFPALTSPLGMTRSGRMFYAVGDTRQLRIYSAAFDFAAGRFVSAPEAVPQDYTASFSAQAWLPQGKRLSYSVVRGSRNNSSIVLAIRSIATGQVREIAPNLAYFDDGKWSPDGQWFLTRGQDLKGRWGIYQINAENGDALPFVLDTSDERNMYPVWAPDGKSFYFPRAYPLAQDRALIQRDLVTGKERVLFRSRYTGGVNISPDGRYMAAADADPSSNTRVLRLVPLAGGEPVEVMRIPSETTPEQLVRNNAAMGVGFSNPSWAPDSRSFLVWKKRQGPTNSELWQVFVDGRQPRAVQAPPVAVAANTFFAVDADGTVAFRYREETHGGVWALDNFLPVEGEK